jgi:hypothetical protein
LLKPSVNAVASEPDRVDGLERVGVLEGIPGDGDNVRIKAGRKSSLALANTAGSSRPRGKRANRVKGTQTDLEEVTERVGLVLWAAPMTNVGTPIRPRSSKRDHPASVAEAEIPSSLGPCIFT